MFSIFIKYFYTIKSLKLIQIKYQILKRIQTKRPEFFDGKIKCKQPYFPLTSYIEKRQSIFPNYEFSFLGSSAHLAQVSWSGKQKSDLWRYNQHYFDDLCSRTSEPHRDLQLKVINLWIAQNIPGSKPGWDAYPTSLRIVNWIKYQLQYQNLNSFQLNNLYNQVLWLEQNVEWHLLGNHLFANAKALIFGGLFFEGDKADIWLSKGLSILKSEINEQVLEDGGHFELSPMYHLIFLEDLLDVINICNAYKIDHTQQYKETVSLCNTTATEMLKWASIMVHPDGRLPFFNDTAMGISTSYEALRSYANSLGIDFSNLCTLKVRRLEKSGYYIWQSSSSKLFFDVGEVGASYLPGHAHADTLSIECSINGRSLIVNSGTSEYSVCELRSYQRSTAAHSTLEINGENSSETWGSFRVARRAKITQRACNINGQSVIFSASHNGYSRLPGKYIHQRSVECTNNQIRIFDKVTGRLGGELRLYFYLAPQVIAKKLSSKRVSLENETGEIDAIIEFSTGYLELKPTSWYPEFGVEQKSSRLEISVVGALPEHIVTTLSWKAS